MNTYQISLIASVIYVVAAIAILVLRVNRGEPIFGDWVGLSYFAGLCGFIAIVIALIQWFKANPN